MKTENNRLFVYAARMALPPLGTLTMPCRNKNSAIYKYVRHINILGRFVPVTESYSIITSWLNGNDFFLKSKQKKQQFSKHIGICIDCVLSTAAAFSRCTLITILPLVCLLIIIFIIFGCNNQRIWPSKWIGPTNWIFVGSFQIMSINHLWNGTEWN